MLYHQSKSRTLQTTLPRSLDCASRLISITSDHTTFKYNRRRTRRCNSVPFLPNITAKCKGVFPATEGAKAIRHPYSPYIPRLVEASNGPWSIDSSHSLCKSRLRREQTLFILLGDVVRPPKEQGTQRLHVALKYTLVERVLLAFLLRHDHRHLRTRASRALQHRANWMNWTQNSAVRIVALPTCDTGADHRSHGIIINISAHRARHVPLRVCGRIMCHTVTSLHEPAPCARSYPRDERSADTGYRGMIPFTLRRTRTERSNGILIQLHSPLRPTPCRTYLIHLHKVHTA